MSSSNRTKPPSRPTSGPFEARLDKDMNWYPAGPSDAFDSWYGGYGYPETRFDSELEAQWAAEFMNRAYLAGMREAQRQMRVVLGLNR